MKWLKQLIGKLKSIGGSKQAKDTTATAPATVATTTEPDEKAEAAEEAATENAKSAAADAAKAEAETVAATEEAATEETAAEVATEEVATEEPAVEQAEPEVAPVAEEPVAEAAPETVSAVDEVVDEPETVVANEDVAAEEPDKATPAGPALSTLDEGAITAELTAAGGPYGPGSAKPAADGAAPSAEFAVKAKESSKLFHSEKSPYFGRTKADVWFKSEADAESAGFQAWDHKKRAAAKK
ncbi:hypothetical protein [Actinophytocola sp. NPDC049390]|uniref:sunset domain-containing protein n=1 Tax=Actinophytocola sp. NPDC049390 TaxID=3363894 RepID=UPI0037890F8F